MAGCIDCKFHSSKITGFDEKTGKSIMTRKCELNHNDEYNKWWDENGTKTRDEISDMNCHEYNDGAKILISMNEKASELLKLLRDENKK